MNVSQNIFGAILCIIIKAIEVFWGIQPRINSSCEAAKQIHEIPQNSKIRTGSGRSAPYHMYSEIKQH